MDDELVEGVSAVVAAEAKNKDDDLDLALDALRDCDTDFIKFDQVGNFTDVYVCLNHSSLFLQENSVSN